MTADTQTLDDLRVEIDEIDDAIHERLMRRAGIVTRLKALKPAHGAPGAMRPGREAEILARRLARHHGPLPHAAIFGVWREIVAASLALQGPFSISVCAPRNTLALWDLARVHFGSAAAMRLYRSPAAALTAVERERSVFAVLPMPTAGEANPWWPRLADAAAEGPWIVARLPQFEPLEATDPGALLIANADVGGEQNAVNLVAVRANTREAPARELGRHLDTVSRPSGYLHLVEVTGVPAGDSGGVATPLGGYAPPLRPSDLSERQR